MGNYNDNSNWKFFLGAGLGLAAGLYANSQQGKEQRKMAADYLAETASTAQQKGTEVLAKSNNLIEDIKNKGINYLASLKSEGNEATDEISQYVEKEMAALEKRVNSKIATAQKVAQKLK